MESVMSIITGFLGGVAALDKVVLVPFVILILALVFGVKLGTAVKSALMMGGGLLGILTINAMMVNYMNPVANGLIANTSATNDMLDMGMTAMFGAVVSLPFFIFLYPIGIAVNLILLSVKWTKTIDVDFLTYFSFLLPVIPIYLLTGNVVATLIGFIIFFALCLKIADWTAPMVKEYYGVDGVSIPHASCGFQAVYVIPLNWLLDKIPGINKINFTLGDIKKKLGVMGEPAIISFLIGFVLGLFAKLGFGPAIEVGIGLSATVYLFPKAIGIMMEGLTPISVQMRSVMTKRYQRDDVYMGMDAAIFSGYPEVVTLQAICIPIALLCYFFLPGSRVLPTAESLQIAIVIGMILPFAGPKGKKGNVFRTILIFTILTIAATYVLTYVSPMVTSLCQNTGFELAEGQVVTSFGMRDPHTGLIYWVMKLLGY